MKKIFNFLFLTCIAISLGSIILIKENNINEAKAASSLPTTIDLNPTSENTIRSYYNSLNNISGQDNILIALKNVLKNNQISYSYDSGDTIREMYEITDRDWDKSPASEIKNGSYNSTTKIISNYVYGKSDINNPYIHALYVNRDVDNPKIAWGSNKRSDQTCIEREHIWAKSHGFKDAGGAGARGDPMHLMAADGAINGIHNQFDFGYVDQSKTYTDGSENFSFTKYNYGGQSLTLGSGRVFEPQDSDKGDIARACFYMAARYNNISGNDNTISTDNPNLLLVDEITSAISGTSTPTQAYSMGILSDLLDWNELDPVDEYEIRRNDILFTNYTNNRNPFIDFPQWADYIWGSKEGNALNPSTDLLHDGASNEVKLTLSNSSVSIRTDRTELISASVNDDNVYSVTWSCDDENIVKLSKYTSLTDEKIFLIPQANVLESVTTYIHATITLENGTIIRKNCKVTIINKHMFDEMNIILNTDTFVVYDSEITGECDKSVFVTNDLKINYSGVNTRTAQTKRSFIYFNNNNSFLYNSFAPAGYYPSKIYGTFSNTVASGAIYKINFSNSILSNKDITDGTHALANEYFEYSNDDPSQIYWNFSTGNNTIRVDSITIVYTAIDPIIEVNQTSISGRINDIKTLIVTPKNFGSYSLTYSWESNNLDVVSMTNENNVATLNLLSYGTALITCEVSSEAVSEEILVSVTVTNETKTLLRIEEGNEGSKNFTAGDAFSKRAIIAYFEGQSEGEDVTDESTFSGYDMNLIGNQTVNVSYTFAGISKETTYVININEPSLDYDEGIFVDGEIQTDYTYGEPFNAPTYKGIFQNGSYYNEKILNVSYSSFDPLTPGDQTIFVTYNNIQIDTFIVTVQESDLDCLGIDVINPKTDYSIGDTFIAPNVIGHFYNEFIQEDIDITNNPDVTFSGYDLNDGGVQTVIVIYSYKGNDYIQEYDINVRQDKLIFDYSQEGYVNGQALKIDYLFMDGYECLSLTPNGNAKYYATGNGARFYNEDTLEIKNEKNNIKRIVLTFDSESDPEVEDISVSCGAINRDGTNWRWIIESTNELIKDTILTFNNRHGAFRLQTLEFYYYTYEEFSNEFIESCKCDSTGITPPVINWNMMSNKFNQLYSFEQNELKSMSGNPFGTEVEKMLAKYDYIVGKYGYDNFIDRTISFFSNSIKFDIDLFEKNQIYICLILFSLLCTAFGYIFIRKKFI